MENKIGEQKENLTENGYDAILLGEAEIMKRYPR